MHHAQMIAWSRDLEPNSRPSDFYPGHRVSGVGRILRRRRRMGISNHSLIDGGSGEGDLQHPYSPPTSLFSKGCQKNDRSLTLSLCESQIQAQIHGCDLHSLHALTIQGA